MSRDEFIWALIRFAGVVFFIMAITTLVGSLPTISFMFRSPDPATYGHMLDQKALQELQKATTRSAFTVTLPIFCYVGIYATVGLYLVCGGKLVFRIIARDKKDAQE